MDSGVKQVVPIKKLKLNKDNPRVIKDEKFKKLVESLKEFPEMADVREIVVNKDFVVLGGNMRLKAMQEAGWDKVPVKIVDWDNEKQREFIIKDNASFGEWNWELLSYEFEPFELEEWGIDLPKRAENKQTELDVDNLLDSKKAIECPRCKFQFERK